MQKFCSKCGAKVRPNAIFCTSCGHKLSFKSRSKKYDNKADKISSSRLYTNSKFFKNQKRDGFKRAQINIGNKIPEKVVKYKNVNFSPPTDMPSRSDFQGSLYSSTNTLITLNKTEHQRKRLENVVLNKTPNILFSLLNESIKNCDDSKLKIKMFLFENKDVYDLLLTETWKNIFEIDVDLKNELNFESIYLTSFYLDKEYEILNEYNEQTVSSLRSEIENISNSKIKLKEIKIKQIRIHKNLFAKFPQNEQLLRMDSVITGLNSKENQLKNNIISLKRILVLIRDIQGKNVKIRKQFNNATRYGIDQLFSGYMVTSFKNHDKLSSLISNLISNQKSFDEIKILFNAIFIDDLVIFPNLQSYSLFYNLINEVIINKTVIKSIKTMDEIITSINSSVSKIENLIKSQSQNLSSIKSGKKNYYALLDSTRKNLLSGSKKKIKFMNIASLDQIVNKRIRTNYQSISELRYLDIFNIINTENLMLDRILLLKSDISKNQKIVKKDLDLSDYQEKTRLTSLSYESPFKTEASRIQSLMKLSPLSTLSTMSSKFLTSDKSENKTDLNSQIYKKFQSIKYKFKKIYFETETKVSCKLHSGNIKNIIWDFSNNNFNIEIDWIFKSKKNLDLSLIVDANREVYSWKESYKDIEILINEENEKKRNELEKKLKKENRIAEKMKSIPGTIKVSIKNDIITIDTQKDTEIINPTLEFIRELVFILNISFKY